ncbi:MAG: glucan endo-1,3-beta-D-glucosidase, partial [Bacteroidetes bacterium CG_4_10_14_3_um_filter_42_6]
MKKIKYILPILVWMLFIFSSCQKDKFELGDLVAPTNVSLTYNIVGVDDENPYGDGSGIVNFIATADNEITFNYVFGDGFDTISANGVKSHRFSKPGVNTYIV